MAMKLNYINQTFNQLTIIKDEGSDRNNHKRALCRCACGTEKVIRLSNVVKGMTKTCGCRIGIKKTHSSFTYMAGHRTRLTIPRIMKGGAFVHDGEVYQVVKVKLL